MTAADAVILVVVYALAGAYVALVHVALGRSRARAGVPDSEGLGLSIVLGVLLLAVLNNYLTPIAGSLWTGVVLLAGPAACGIVMLARRGRQGPSTLVPRRFGVVRDLVATIVCATFILAIAHKLFTHASLSASGLLYPDLPWHIGRVAQQAFQSTPGFWPLSPMAFPGSLPFISFAADSLVAATFRYLPLELHAFHYSQVLFCWAMVLWTAVVLVAGSGFWRSLLSLATALFVIPAFLFGVGRVGLIVFIFFHANPNSLMAWPIGLTLTLHLYRAFERGLAPWRPFLVLVPPASVFFKTNQAFSFGFLQALGFALAYRAHGASVARRWIAEASAAWAGAIVLSTAMGSWPAAGGIRPALANLQHYAHIALPDLRDWQGVAWRWASYIVLVTIVSAAAQTMRKGPRGDLFVPPLVLTAAMLYLIAGWIVVAPNGLADGEPMHVNFELIMWLITATVACRLCGLYDPPAESSRRQAAVVAVSCLALALSALTVRATNSVETSEGGVPMNFNYDIAAEERVRAALASEIEGGHCFWYGRRYAIDVGAPYDPDTIIAATGCPVINGKRWRAYLGANDPEALRKQSAIEVNAGRRFTLVRIP